MHTIALTFRNIRPHHWATLCVLMFIAGCATGRPAPLAERDSVRVLGVGNSFTDNATAFLPKLAEAGGKELVIERAIIGGSSLEQHWRKAEQFETDPNNPVGKYKSGKSLREYLTQERWDFVTIQQFSRISHDPSTHQPWANNLRDYIKQHAPSAELLVHQTWAYRADDASFTPEKRRPEWPQTQREMYEKLTAAYDQLAQSLDARIIPSGDAFYRVDTDPAWGFKPVEVDRAALKHPDVPPQPNALHLGWHWAKDAASADVLRHDTTHANTAGKYLAACVWYEVLFNDSVLDNPFVPQGLDPAHAEFLRHAAHEAVAKRAGAPVGSATEKAASR